MKSPCVKRCLLNEDFTYCIGCFRTPDEIRDWGSLIRHQKQAILDQLPTRKDIVTGQQQ